MNLFRKVSLIAAAGIAFSASVAWADAVTFDSAGDTVTLNYDGMSDGQTVAGLNGSTTLTLTSITGTSYNFTYSVANTGSTSDSVNSRISSFGFNVDPTLSSASSTGTYSFTTIGGQAPSPFKDVDVCFKAGGSNSCSGSGGLFDGQSGSGTLTLDFATAPNSISLSDFFVRYQSITGAGNVTSAIGGGTITSTGGSTGGTPVPEPGMLGLLGLSLIGMALVRRRPAPRRAMPELALA